MTLRGNSRTSKRSQRSALNFFRFAVYWIERSNVNEGGGGGVSREKIRRIEEKSRNKRRGGRRITFERRKAHETAKKDNGKVF